jgi:glucose-6-phosphate isomerase/transaldolase/glucose-6-phosphate isomerase
VTDDAQALLTRLQARDESLWPAGNVSGNRLGWLDVPTRMQSEAIALAEWARTIDQSTVVLLGMGGSSLGPAVLQAAKDAGSHDSRSGSSPRRLIVCDTTHPATIASLELSDAFVLVSSKSGTTLEPNDLFSHAWSLLPDPSRYAAVTDPGTPLAKLAAERGFARCFENPPDIGGRYSVLSYFGMVPAALIGYDIAELCSRALATDLVEAVALGMTIGEEVRAGRDKLTVVLPDAYAGFGLWVEQLVAESTGKQGTGCVPVPTTVPEQGADRHVVQLHPGEPVDLAEQFYRFEVAVAICGHVLGIDPFDEPNVAESKQNTNDVLAHLPVPELEAREPSGAFPWLADTFRPGDYVSLQAYLPLGQDQDLETLRRSVRDRLGGGAVTAGYGPRFLHSTGQLHKGGPDSVIAVQIVSRTAGPTVPVPGKPYDFGTLIAAQSVGDHRSLVAHGRRVLRVAVDDLAEIA